MVKGRPRIDAETLIVRSTGETPAHREDLKKKLQKLPFIAWDGEGYDDANGVHHYMLFGNSKGTSVQAASLNWQDCFPLMLDAPEGNHVIYGGTYDITMMTRDMPLKIIQRLQKGKPTRYDGYRMQWFKGKYFDLKEINGTRKVRLYDVMTFFATSFVKACKEYLGDSPDLDTMQEMKLRRGDFTQSDKSVKPYWESELVYLVDLMNKLRSLLHEVGIEPRGWHGPGAVAGALLQSHNMGDHIPPQPDEVIDAAERAYYGGRFEQFQVGRIESAHEYDIRSAYPTAIANLPSLRNVEWEHRTDNFPDEIDKFGLYCISWDLTKGGKQFPVSSIPGPFPWRLDNGNIYYPRKGHRSWYWGIEVQNILLFPGTYEIHECYLAHFPGSAKERPFKWVEEMYEQRATMKAEGNPAQLAVKLGLNSLYGKLAQSKGAKFNKETEEWKKPRWHTIIYAGWISAFTRRAMFKAMMSVGGLHRLIAVETDAIFTTHPHPRLTDFIGVGLGEWEHTEIDEILYVQSGMYYAIKDGMRRLKSRGLESDKSHDSEYWLEIFKHLPQEKITVVTTVRRFGTDPRRDNYATWFDFNRTITLPAIRSKRIHIGGRRCKACRDSKRTATYADCAHELMVPEFRISHCEWTESTPYPFPWRKDNTFDWGEVTELVVYDKDIPMEVSWS